MSFQKVGQGRHFHSAEHPAAPVVWIVNVGLGMSSRNHPLTTANVTLATIATALLGSSGCRAVEGIFRAGIWTGIVAFVLVCALVFGLMRLFVRG